MPGRLPDPHTRKRNKSSRALPSTMLPASGYDGPIPNPPGNMSDAARARYDRAWRSAPASSWTESEADAVSTWARLAALVDEQLDQGFEPKSALLGQLKAREDSLGLNPKSRLQMRLVIVDDEDGSAGWEPKSESTATPIPPEITEKLREMGLA